MGEPEAEDLFLFEWLNLVSASMLAISYPWRRRHGRPSSKALFAALFLICLGIPCQFAQVFDPQWRQRVRLIFFVVRVLAAAELAGGQPKVSDDSASNLQV